MEIQLVTAYFNIGRNSFKNFNRDDNKYISYFKFWSGIKNKLVIYTTKEYADYILEIRKKNGLGDKTKIVIVDNIRNFDIDLYNRIYKAMNNEYSLNFHKNITHPESYSVDYNYIMMLKYYCIVDAIENKYVNGMIAWIDFGFNHGGDDGLINCDEFNFLWQYNFSNKIHLFSGREINNFTPPIFEIVRNMDVYIRGNIMIAPDYLWRKFLCLVKNSMLSLTRCGLCDDDQTISLMAYYEKPDIFEIHKVKHWYDALKCFGGEHFTVKTDKMCLCRRKELRYKLYKEKSNALFAYGKYKLSLIYYSKYIFEKIKTKY